VRNNTVYRIDPNLTELTSILETTKQVTGNWQPITDCSPPFISKNSRPVDCSLPFISENYRPVDCSLPFISENYRPVDCSLPIISEKSPPFSGAEVTSVPTRHTKLSCPHEPAPELRHSACPPCWRKGGTTEDSQLSPDAEITSVPTRRFPKKEKGSLPEALFNSTK
jgi:hypothetical protein